MQGSNYHSTKNQSLPVRRSAQVGTAFVLHLASNKLIGFSQLSPTLVFYFRDQFMFREKLDYENIPQENEHEENIFQTHRFENPSDKLKFKKESKGNQVRCGKVNIAKLKHYFYRLRLPIYGQVFGKLVIENGQKLFCRSFPKYASVSLAGKIEQACVQFSYIPSVLMVLKFCNEF